MRLHQSQQDLIWLIDRQLGIDPVSEGAHGGP
jgi:hypothetical protein